MNIATQNCLDTTDYRGKRVIFTEKKRNQKAVQHSELYDPSFITNLEKAIQAPDEVWEDYDDPTHKRCYYKRFGIDLYAKAVIWVTGYPYQIVSAFETNRIKETNYPGLRRLV